jgi:proteic killer suppression protein
MDIDFEDSRLAMIETEAAADTRLPVAVIQSARHRLCILRAAPDLQTAQAWRSLGLQPRPETAEHLVMLSPPWAMVVTFIEKNNPMTVIVKKLEERLRGAA